jgi:ribonuclease E
VRTVRDYLTDDVLEVLIDDQEAYRNTKQFLSKTLPWLKINIKFYKDRKPIFLKHSIEEQIANLNERYVYLPSKGYLVIDKTEALTAIDVNSGRSRKEENVESTALKTNTEAAEEVARQFRLRDIGGLIVIDFIDMESSKNRRIVEATLKAALSQDKAHTEISGISKFGMIEMTRERMRTAYFESINRQCEICNGSGIVMSDEMLAITAFREIHARAAQGGIKSITCKLPVESMNYLVNLKRDDIMLIEKEDKVSIKMIADIKLFPGQYSITVEKSEEEKTSVREEIRAQHTPEHTPEHRIEHKAEYGIEHKAETESQPKRRSRSRGRRRPRRGPKTELSAAVTPTLSGETSETKAEIQHKETLSD